MQTTCALTLAPLATALLLSAFASRANAQHLTVIDMAGKRITTSSRSASGSGFVLSLRRVTEVNGRSLEHVVAVKATAMSGSNVRAIYTSDASGRPGPATFTIQPGSLPGMHSRVNWTKTRAPNTRVRVKGPARGEYLYGIPGPWTVEVEAFLHRPRPSSPSASFDVTFLLDELRIAIRRPVGRSCGPVDLMSTGAPERPRLSISGLSPQQLAVMLWTPDRAYFKPLDLTMLGAPGCVLHFRVRDVLVLPMTRTGSTASMNARLALPGPHGTRARSGSTSERSRLLLDPRVRARDLLRLTHREAWSSANRSRFPTRRNARLSD